MEGLSEEKTEPKHLGISILYSRVNRMCAVRTHAHGHKVHAQTQTHKEKL